MKIWIISFVAYGDRTETVQIFDKFFCTRKGAEETAKWLRACGHTAVKIVPLVQGWRLVLSKTLNRSLNAADGGPKPASNADGEDAT